MSADPTTLAMQSIGVLAQQIDDLAIAFTKDVADDDTRATLIVSAIGVVFAFRTGATVYAATGHMLGAEELAEKCRTTPWLNLTKAAADALAATYAEGQT